jgi:hypothetical protein
VAHAEFIFPACDRSDATFSRAVRIHTSFSVSWSAPTDLVSPGVGYHCSLRKAYVQSYTRGTVLGQRLSRTIFFEKEKRAATVVQHFGPAKEDRRRSKRSNRSTLFIMSVGENRALSILLGDRNPLSAKLATKRMGMHWIGKAPDYVIPHSRFLPRQLIRPIRQRMRAAKLVHSVDHRTHCARRNTDQDSVRKIPADPHHAACH